MTNVIPMNSKHSKNKVQDNDEMVVDFGTRKINSQNFSKTVVLPKEALRNCGCDLDGKEDPEVKVDLVKNGKESFIKLTPMCSSNKGSSTKDKEEEK